MKVGFIKAAAIAAFLQGLAQAAVTLSASSHSFAQALVIATMKGSHFTFGGLRRSYWDLLVGYNFFAAGVWIAEAVLLWLIAGIAGKHPDEVKPLLWLLLLANIAHAAAVFVWFTPLPLLFDAVVVALLSLALIQRRQKSSRIAAGEG